MVAMVFFGPAKTTKSPFKFRETVPSHLKCDATRDREEPIGCFGVSCVGRGRFNLIGRKLMFNLMFFFLSDGVDFILQIVYVPAVRFFKEIR